MGGGAPPGSAPGACESYLLDCAHIYSFWIKLFYFILEVASIDH